MGNNLLRHRNTSAGLPKARSNRLLRSGMVLSLLGMGAFLPACHRNIDIVSRTVTTGSVNGVAFKGSVSATINTGRGGRSTCSFEQLPPHFTPGTIGTHA